MDENIPLGRCQCEHCRSINSESDSYNVTLVDSVDGSILTEMVLCESCVFWKRHELETLPIRVQVQRLVETYPVPQKG